MSDANAWEGRRSRRGVELSSHQANSNKVRQKVVVDMEGKCALVCGGAAEIDSISLVS